MTVYNSWQRLKYIRYEIAYPGADDSFLFVTNVIVVVIV